MIFLHASATPLRTPMAVKPVANFIKIIAVGVCGAEAFTRNAMAFLELILLPTEPYAPMPFSASGRMRTGFRRSAARVDAHL